MLNEGPGREKISLLLPFTKLYSIPRTTLENQQISSYSLLKSLVRTLTNLGLIDEYQLLVHPIILGSGMPLFQDIKHQLKFKPVNTKTHPSGVVVLFYQPGEG